jgi:hypothetical protein
VRETSGDNCCFVLWGREVGQPVIKALLHRPRAGRGGGFVVLERTGHRQECRAGALPGPAYRAPAGPPDATDGFYHLIDAAQNRRTSGLQHPSEFDEIMPKTVDTVADPPRAPTHPLLRCPHICWTYERQADV